MPNSLFQRYPKHFEIPLLLLVSTGLLTAAWMMPLMHVEKLVFWKNEYSILTGITGLWTDGEYFLSGILFVFCLVFPAVKLATLWIMWPVKFNDNLRDKVLNALGFLGKWSMLDVFVVAILIVAVKLGPVASVEPRPGVYVFCAAILLSMITTAWVEHLFKR